jgi:hypothetical protein
MGRCRWSVVKPQVKFGAWERGDRESRRVRKRESGEEGTTELPCSSRQRASCLQADEAVGKFKCESERFLTPFC